MNSIKRRIESDILWLEKSVADSPYRAHIIFCLRDYIDYAENARAGHIRLTEDARIACGLSKCCDTCWNQGKILCLPPAEGEECPDYEFDVVLALEKHQRDEFIRAIEERGDDRRIVRALADHYLGGNVKYPANGKE